MNNVFLKLSTLILVFNLLLIFISNTKIDLSKQNIVKNNEILGINTIDQFINTQGSSIIQSSYLSTNYQDYRAFVLDKYFERYNSPLKAYGTDFIVACDKYGLSKDCTVIPAIAYVETGLCTLGLSAKQFNCWGFGGSDENRVIFRNFSDSIDTVTRILAGGYGNSLFDPNSIAHVYCGPQCTKWGDAVNQQRNAIKRMANEYNLPSIN